MNQLAQDLRAAKALIDTPEKWGKGKHYDGFRWCLSGALNEACDGNGKRYANSYAAMRSVTGAGPAALCVWNDEPHRTHSDVLAAFDKAIEKAEAQP